MTRIAPQQAYAVLGVTSQDDFATIRKAWVRLVKENHPDALGGDIETATRRLSRINDAYDSLRWHSPEKLRIHKAREDQRRQEARDERTRREDALRTRRTSPVNRAKTARRDTAPSEDPGRQAPTVPALREVGNLLADHARRNYREVQKICNHVAEAVMIRDA
ncbi:J domain-containing protein [Antarctobacter sp.]|uniref:J domain-containing protein n=1 Tax=Antarctobacter sp. TaxID=1872577 RepID=UPI002B273F35|nr:J domain-containing protein [Antarctobacter sp.]